MDALGMFREQYELAAAAVDDLVLAGLDQEQLRTVPAPTQNSVAWLLWHTARYEDLWVNTWLAERPQVFDEGGWIDRIGVGRRDVGTGWTPDECAEFNAKVDVDALLAYVRTVRDRTREVVAGLDPASLEEVVPDEVVRRGAVDGAVLNERAPVLDGLFAGQTRAWFLALLNMHAAEHAIGEALCVRSQAGFPLGI